MTDKQTLTLFDTTLRDGAQTHGTLTWKSATPRHSVLFHVSRSLQTLHRKGMASPCQGKAKLGLLQWRRVARRSLI